MGVVRVNTAVRRESRQRTALGLSLSLVLSLSSRAFASPAITWMSEPAKPGDVVLLYGGDLSAVRAVAVWRLADSAAAAPPGAALPPRKEVVRAPTIQPSPGSLKFVLPTSLAPGVLAVDVGGTPRLFGLPQVDWLQMTRLLPGLSRDEAAPGATLQIVGRNFSINPSGTAQVSVAMRGSDGHVVGLPVSVADKYSIVAKLPEALPLGDYTLWVHNGFGGPQGWGGGLTVRIHKPSSWPSRVFNVRDFGARGDNITDDSDAFHRALSAIEKNGGGVIYCPAGTYRLNGTFRLPRRVLIRGDGKYLTWLKWPQAAPKSSGDFIPAVLTGRGEYGIEQLSLMVRNAKTVLRDDTFAEVSMEKLVPPQGDPDADHGRDVFLREVAFYYTPYVGTPSQNPVNDAQWAYSRWGLTETGGQNLTVALGGIRTLEVSDCEFIGTQRFLDVRNGRFTGNHFSNPMGLSWTDLGGQHVVFEHNKLDGASSWRTAQLPLRHIYVAYNAGQNLGRGDREMLTMDVGQPPWLLRKGAAISHAWVGRVASTAGRKLHFAQVNLATGAYRNFEALIVSGRGAGQYRHIEDNTRDGVQVARNWEVQPDTSSVIFVQRLMGHCVFYRNSGEDVSVLGQIWGEVYDCTFDSNETKRSQGIWGLGGWFIQWIDNTLENAVTFHSGIGPAGPTPDGTAEYGYLGFTVAGLWTKLGQWEHVRAAVMRGNRLSYGYRVLIMWGYGGAHREAGFTIARDVVIDRNAFDHTPIAIELDANVEGALIGTNSFTDVELPLRLEAPQKVTILRSDPPTTP
jgi:hypothetical protein